MADKSNLLSRILAEGGELSVSPQVLSRFSDICKDPAASAGDLAKVLQMDAGLTSRILKMVNSSFYGFAATIKTVTQAIVLIGFKEVRSLALSVPIASLYQGNTTKDGLNIATLWKHNLETACLARIIAIHIKYEIPEQILVMAIIRNIGMIAINNVLGAEYMELVRVNGGSEDFPQAERKTLGLDHCEVGARLADRWHFPPELADFIRNHHYAVRDGEILIEPAIMRAARWLLQGLARGETIEAILARFPDGIGETLQLTPEVVADMIEANKEDFETAKAMLEQ